MSSLPLWMNYLAVVVALTGGFTIATLIVIFVRWLDP